MRSSSDVKGLSLTAMDFAHILGDGVLISAGDSVVEIRDGAAIRKNVVESDLSEASPKRILPQQVAFDRINSALRTNSGTVTEGMIQARNNSQRMFNWMIGSAVTGFILTIVGFLFALNGRADWGVINGIAGLIPEAVAAFFFQKERELRSYVEESLKKMLEFQRTVAMIDVAETIESAKDRDRVKQEIILAVLGVSAKIKSNGDDNDVGKVHGASMGALAEA